MMKVEVDHLHPCARVDEDLPIALADETRTMAVSDDQGMDSAGPVQSPRAALVVGMRELKDLIAKASGEGEQPAKKPLSAKTRCRKKCLVDHQAKRMKRRKSKKSEAIMKRPSG